MIKDSLDHWLTMQRLERQIQQDITKALTRASYPMALNEFYTLYYLENSQEYKLQISELSEKIGLSISAVSRMLVRFEETCGVIERHTCIKDKRGVEIALTPLGKERLMQAEKTVTPVLKKYQTILEKMK